MSHAVKALGCACVALAFSSAIAITTDATSNPYQGIVDRNVFGLKDPPPPAPPPDTNKQQGPALTLVGIMNILGKNTACLSFQSPAKPNEPPKPTSLMLTQGQREGEIEILEIDINNRSVQVSSYGAITNLTFEKNGIKGSGGPSTPTPGIAAIPAPQPAAATFTPGGSSFPGIKGIPPRMIRTGQPGQPGQPGAEGSSPAVFTPGSTVGSTPGSFNFTPGATPPQPQGLQHDNLTPEQREVLLEANHLSDLQKGDPKASIYPPSFLNPNRNLAPAQGTTQPQPGPGAPRPPGSY
jgi:hypothetical protein